MRQLEAANSGIGTWRQNVRQIVDIARDLEATSTIVELTSVFEDLASSHISQIKNQVQQSGQFFADLWRIYTQIRVDKLFHFGRGRANSQVINKELMILVTSEGGLSGDIDNNLIDVALGRFKPRQNDIIIVGQHGALLLTQRDVKYARSFKLPTSDRRINVAPLVSEVKKYASTIVFYQTYLSLMNQAVKSIKLSTAVAELGKNVKAGSDVISESNYIFEPSTFAVVDYLEHSMMGIALSDVILESKLAQYASRFRAMSVAGDKAKDSLAGLNRLHNQARRNLKDERAKEVINGIRKAAL